jgi:predicted CXXCH cytochrome family protein
MFAVCGSCHSRRADLTGDFHPGETFFDHYGLTIPDDTDLFYPDGQIREEDYEFNAFLGSRMHAAGVRCLDCHEPHSSKTRVVGNNLCMICHAGPAPPAPKIDATTHSHHKTGERGDACVDCHMPQTVYMQRHARHDHGFTIPDPLLTKQLKIPNACNRCHSDKTPDWSLAAIEKWYGPSHERPARARTSTVARARAGDAGVVPELLRLLVLETNGYWRAVSANLLRRWAADAKVMPALLSSAQDSDPLVRAMSVRALEPLAGSGNDVVQTVVGNRLTDPVRSVRIDAAWALHATIETNSIAGSDLMHYLHFSADQPVGAMQLGIFHLDRDNLPVATSYLQRAVNWDTNSAPPHHALAVALSMEGRNEAALRELQAACRLAPREAEYRFKLGLAWNELGNPNEARAALEQAVKIDPQFARAWYNLGLAYNATGNTESALDSLIRAESLDTHSATIPYARATILARLGRTDEARTAARRALEIDPAYADAAALLGRLPR